MDRSKYIEVLSKYIPPKTVHLAVQFIQDHNVRLHIKRPRVTKHGDYQPSEDDTYHKITINIDLNKNAFLITLLHEFAHAICYEKHMGRVSPHGKEWKQEFITLYNIYKPFADFPESLLKAMEKYFANPKASSCSDADLYRELRPFNHADEDVIFLSEIGLEQKFNLNGRIMMKKKKLRTRFECIEIRNKRLWSVSSIALVKLVEK